MYRRRRFRGFRRRRGRFARRRGRGGGYGGLALKAFHLAKWAVANLNVEKKFFDVAAFSGTAISSTGTTVQLTNIPSQEGDVNQGATRDGDQIKWKSILLRGACLIHASATATGLRMMLVRDDQPNAGNPAVSDVLEAVAPTPVTDPMNLANRRRFHILMDKVWSMVIGTEKVQYQWHHYFKVSTTSIWAGDATDEPTSGSSYFLLAVSTEPTNTPTLTCHARLRFIDN